MPWHNNDAIVRNIAVNTILQLKQSDWNRDEITAFIQDAMLCKGFWGLMEKEIKYFVNLAFEKPGLVAELREIDFYEVFTNERESETFLTIFPACDKLNEAGYLT